MCYTLKLSDVTLNILSADSYAYGISTPTGLLEDSKLKTCHGVK